jgi:adenine-specific DNA-methyltransferase
MTDDLKTVNLEAEKLDLNSLDIAAEKQAELLRLFPEVRTEGGKVDFDRLRLALGEAVDVGKERYGMNWPGKADCFKSIQRPSLGTLLPAREESVNFDETENLIIEGDNLEVLKLLQKSYPNKIKMIYIDPPYNTGNDFIYPDNYSENLQTYLEYTGQVDSEGRKFSNNTETDGRFHSKWLNMMYPRLYMARNLLADDGAIFISIDDHELNNLKKICDDVLGEENYKGTIVRATGQTTGQDSGGLGSSFDYVLVYFKQPDVEMSGLPLSDEDIERYEGEDAKGKFALWQLRKTGSSDRREDRPTMFYAATAPDGTKVWPTGPTGYESRWRFDPKGYKKLVEDDYIVWKKRKNNGTEEWWPYVKTYLEGRTKRPSPLWDDLEGSKKASIDLRDLIGKKVFDNPKPVGLIKRLIEIAPDASTDSLVLDFFAGSGSTGQAVLELNALDGGNRRFILVQLPENTKVLKKDGTWMETEASKAGYKTIADITKDRIRRVIQRHERDAEGKLKLGNQSKEGFRVLKLATSNFKIWNAATETTTPDALAKQLELQIDHIQRERTSEDLLYEILLKAGFPPTTPIETLTVEGKKVYSVTGYGMLICLERQLTHETIKAIAKAIADYSLDRCRQRLELEINCCWVMTPCGRTPAPSRSATKLRLQGTTRLEHGKLQEGYVHISPWRWRPAQARPMSICARFMSWLRGTVFASSSSSCRASPFVKAS